jgi:hypothetical protein
MACTQGKNHTTLALTAHEEKCRCCNPTCILDTLPSLFLFVAFNHLVGFGFVQYAVINITRGDIV